MTLASPTQWADDAASERWVPLRVKVALAAFGIALFGFICYGIGTNHGGGSHVLTGRAYVGPTQASVPVAGRYYGFDISANDMMWYDGSDGSVHEGGIPPCLQHSGYAWIRFGYANAISPTGGSWRVVTWVQCIDHH